MRMMIDMIMMATKARTAANTATWEKRAAAGKKRKKRREYILTYFKIKIEINILQKRYLLIILYDIYI